MEWTANSFDWVPLSPTEFDFVISNMFEPGHPSDFDMET